MSKELVFRETDWGNGYYGGYDDLVESCGNVAEITENWTLGSYQGDEVYLIKGYDGKIGFVVQGYGSCSGCDALQSCDTRQEVESLRDGICEQIEWFDTYADLYAKLTDPEINRWYFYEAEWKDIANVIGEKYVEPGVKKAA